MCLDNYIHRHALSADVADADFVRFSNVYPHLYIDTTA